MSESREPSYYEIALTNTQVLVAFGILLLCVGGAFVSGMWVARESLRDRLEAAEREEPAPVAPEGDAQRETFEFFGEEGAAPANGEAPPLLPPISSEQRAAESNERRARDAAPPAERPAEPAQVATADERVAANAEEDRAAAERDERPAAVQPAPPTVTESREPEREPSSEAREPSAASERATPSPEAEPQPGAGAVVIQVLSSSEEQQANGLIARLRADGYRAFLSPVDVNGRTMYRVRVGPYPNREAAEVDAEKLKRTHRLDTWFPRS